MLRMEGVINMIGIIGAMDEEVISLKRKMIVKQQRDIASMTFFVGTVNEKEVVVVRCGIGKVNAAICTQILIDLFEVKYIINTGVAGGLYPELEIGDIVVSSDTVEHDMDASAVGNPRGEIPRMQKTYFEADEKLIDAAKKAAETLKDAGKVYVGRVASGDQFVCSMQVREDIYATFTAYCAEMEGAAIAHTCYLNQVPFVIIRAISDKADQSADVNFEEFVDVAAKNASKMIEGILKTI